MSKLLKLENKKLVYLVFLLGIIISINYAFFNLNKFDKNEDVNKHLMIRGDLSLIWNEAESFKKDLLKNKTIFGNGDEYTRTFLPSKIVAFYSILTNQDLYDDYENRVIKIKGKRLYLLFQIFFYYLSLLFLYKKLKSFYENKNLSFYIVSYLALDPNIIQWHGTFWTESIFFSLQLLLIGLIIKSNKSNLFCLYLGSFLGLIFLQKTVGILFIFFLVIYIFYTEKKNRKLKFFNIIFGFSIILLILGYDNYKKTGIFYVMPLQTKSAHYVVLVPQIFIKNNQLEAFSNAEDVEKEWKKNNNWSKNNFKIEYKFKKFQQKKALEIMLDNKVLVLQIYLKKIINHSVLNPLQTFYWHKYNTPQYSGKELHLSAESKKYFIYKIFYSILFYIILLFGFLSIAKDKKYFKFHLLLISLVNYLIFMLGWVGNSRYFMPSIIFLSIFFGHGIDYISKLRYKSLRKP
jgi:hypothetical protein